MDEEEENELGIRVSVHLIGEAFEALGYRFWCHELTEWKRHDCAIQKESPQGGKYTPKAFSLNYIIHQMNGYVRLSKEYSSDYRDFLLADPDITQQVVKAILNA